MCCQMDEDEDAILITLPPLFVLRDGLREDGIALSKTWWEDGQGATEGAITFGLVPGSEMNLNLTFLLCYFC